MGFKSILIYEYTWTNNELGIPPPLSLSFSFSSSNLFRLGILVDICWMSSLSLFVILSIHSLYLYDPVKSSPNIPMKVETIKALDRSHVFASLSAFDRDLYINYHKGVPIDQYRVVGTSEWILQKRYSKGELCEAKDIGIRDVRANKEHVCFSIMQQDDLKWRLDLMSRDMIRVRRGVAMDHGENQHKFFSMLIPIDNQCWLFVNWFTNKLWIVDQQGKTRLIKESKIKNIRNIALSQDSNHLAIRLEKPATLNVYKLFR